MIRLRAMICVAESECSAFEKENLAIKSTLSQANISTSSDNFVITQPSRAEANLSDFNFEFQSPETASPSSNSQPQLDMSRALVNPSATVASIGFDHQIDALCLHVNQPTVLNSPDIFNFPKDTFSVTNLNAAPNSSSHGPLYQLSLYSKLSSRAMPTQPDTSDIAINFILA